MSRPDVACAPLRYAGGHLDRAAIQRKDEDWIAQQLARTDAALVPVWRYRNLATTLRESAAAPRALLPQRAGADAIVEQAGETVFLGLQDGQAVFALDVSACHEDTAAALAHPGEFVDLRRIGPLLPARDAALCAYARGMLYWHAQHRFCSRCGYPAHSRQGGHVRMCSNAGCKRVTFPRTDPAVIMLVTAQRAPGQPERCLLGRDPRWPKGTYSTLAGFVEPGESLEEAVAREVHEEVGIVVEDVRYLASQPWPFPSSIMLGFRARARTTALRLDREEVEDARWFTADEVNAFGEWGSGAALQVPRRDSIARFLIDTWVAESLR